MPSDKIKKISTNIPARLLKEASDLAGLNQTEVLIDGLREVVAREQRQRLLKLKGKVKIELDVSKTRGRVKT